MATQTETTTQVKTETDPWDAPLTTPWAPPALEKGKNRQEKPGGFPDPQHQSSQAPDYRPSGSGGYIPYGLGTSTMLYSLLTETTTPYRQVATSSAPQQTSYTQRYIQTFGQQNLEDVVE